MIERLATDSIRIVTLVALVVAFGMVSGAALAGEKVFLIAVGVNRPAHTSGVEHPPLQFADDDAAAVFDLVSAMTDAAHLLTVMDSETQALYPKLVKRSQVPTMNALDAAVADVAGRIRDARANNDESSVILFFSGHGTLAHDGIPSLLLSDAKLTKAFLYDRVLKRLPADRVHLLVDACHAEAVVRPRQLEAETVAVNPSEAQAFLMRSTLASFPHVGAIVAASSDSDAHEWDVVRHGVFTYELLSALRGAADINRDRILEYSEIYAFMASANRGIRHPRIRPTVVAKPPEVDRRAPLLDLSRLPRQGSSWLLRVPHDAGLVHISDALGRRLTTLRSSPDFMADVVLPAGADVYVRRNGVEARFTPRNGGGVLFSSLRFTRSDVESRGYADQALRRGLFSSGYGRGYYLGFIDQAHDFVAVDFGVEQDSSPVVEFRPGSESGFETVLTSSAGVGSVVARELDLGHGFQFGLRPQFGAGPVASFEVLRAADGGYAEWRSELSAGLLWPTNSGRIQGWLGAAVGGGLIYQSLVGEASRRSGVVSVSPISALSVKVGEALRTWTEVQYSGRMFRQNGNPTLVFSPSMWMGVGVGL